MNRTGDAAVVAAETDFTDTPGAVDVTVVASMVDDDGHRWLVVEERRLSLLLVDRDVAEGSEWVLSPVPQATTAARPVQ